ncbi:protein of unknown function [Methylorubrum extorquens]|uniref:Uncharacterized protein n=1 Tax=Methylorubrum extorquens TaxID=408 RepID=A0A2N9ALU8_METEX|nr:protein of unknown function [Methylorubrum extorquens]
MAEAQHIRATLVPYGRVASEAKGSRAVRAVHEKRGPGVAPSPLVHTCESCSDLIR